MNWLIYLIGSNAANQPMCYCAPIAIVEADDAEAAKEITAKRTPVYANQFLRAVTEDDADPDDWNAVSDLDALARSHAEGEKCFGCNKPAERADMAGFWCDDC